MQALITGARADRSTALRKAFASAAGAVAKYAAPARADQMVSEAVALFKDPGRPTCVISQYLRDIFALLILSQEHL